MTDLQLLPDIEALVVHFLLDQPELDEFFANAVNESAVAVTTFSTDRVYSVLPKSKQFPAVRVTRFGGLPRMFKPRYLDAAEIQIDGFAPTRDQAVRLTETCGSLLAARLTGWHDQGVVTGVDVGGLRPGDSDFEKIHMRLLTATVYAHPHPALIS